MTEVSIIIPCRNEEKAIGRCLDSLIAQDYLKDKLEVLVVDGMSDDGTRQIVKEYAEKYPFIDLVDNSKRWTVFAFNTGVKNTHRYTKYITILNAHGSYPPERIKKSIKYIEKYNVDAVGGVSKAISGKVTAVGKAIACVLSSPFGVGSSFRIQVQEPKLTDTASGCLYKKEVFDKIGLFNEELICSQDIEFNKRLIKAGGKVLLAPDVVTYYHARSDFKSYVKHNFRNGLWAILPFKYSSVMPVSLRHLIPLIFVLALIGSGVMSIFLPTFRWLFLLILGSYVLVNLYFSAKIFLAKKEVGYLFLMPIMFATLHFTYGVGSLWGLLKVVMSKQFWKNWVINKLCSSKT